MIFSHAKLIQIVMLILLIPQSFLSQEYSIRGRIGYGTYNLEDVKSFHNMLRNEVSTKVSESKVVKEFPPYLNFQFQFFLINPTHNFGFLLDKASTGARITYSDYSGELSLNTIVQKYSFGIILEKFINRRGPIDLYTYVQLTYIYTALDVEEYIEIFDENVNTTTAFSSNGIGLEPGVGFAINVFPFVLRTDFGFQINYSSDFEGSGNNSGKLNGISAEWWGFRLGLVLGYEF